MAKMSDELPALNECDTRWRVYCLGMAGMQSVYVGATVDLHHRLRQHNGEILGGAKRTRRLLWERGTKPKATGSKLAKKLPTPTPPKATLLSSTSAPAPAPKREPKQRHWVRHLHVGGFHEKKLTLQFEWAVTFYSRLIARRDKRVQFAWGRTGADRLAAAVWHVLAHLGRTRVGAPWLNLLPLQLYVVLETPAAVAAWAALELQEPGTMPTWVVVLDHASV